VDEPLNDGFCLILISSSDAGGVSVCGILARTRNEAIVLPLVYVMIGVFSVSVSVSGVTVFFSSCVGILSEY